MAICIRGEYPFHSLSRMGTTSATSVEASTWTAASAGSIAARAEELLQRFQLSWRRSGEQDQGIFSLGDGPRSSSAVCRRSPARPGRVLNLSSPRARRCGEPAASPHGMDLPAAFPRPFARQEKPLAVAGPGTNPRANQTRLSLALPWHHRSQVRPRLEASHRFPRVDSAPTTEARGLSSAAAAPWMSFPRIRICARSSDRGGSGWGVVFLHRAVQTHQAGQLVLLVLLLMHSRPTAHGAGPQMPAIDLDGYHLRWRRHAGRQFAAAVRGSLRVALRGQFRAISAAMRWT